MPTDAAQAYRYTQARNFALRGVAWSLGLFAVVRLSWFDTHAVLPLTQLQARVAQVGFGAPALPIAVTLACSGADAIALCAGAILAYPVRWHLRLAGASAGIGLILALNTVRIGTLGQAAASPSWFEVLHVYVWPALLTLAIAGYAFTWMRFADHALPRNTQGRTFFSAISAASAVRPDASPFLTKRFVVLTAALRGSHSNTDSVYTEYGM